MVPIDTLTNNSQRFSSVGSMDLVNSIVAKKIRQKDAGPTELFYMF